MSAAELHRWDDLPERDLADGVSVRKLDATGMTLLRGRLEEGAIVPEHAHPQEQMTWVLSGALRSIVAGEELVVGAGEVIVIPGGAPHGSTALVETEILEAFSPRREDLAAAFDDTKED